MPDFFYSCVRVPGRWIRDARPRHAAKAWTEDQITSLVRSREVGDLWFMQRRRYDPPILQVPSVVIPQEANYLLDATDKKIRALAWLRPEPFRFDPRLLDPTLR